MYMALLCTQLEQLGRRQDILSDQSDALSKQSKENTMLLDDIAQTLDGPGTQLSVTSMRPTGPM